MTHKAALLIALLGAVLPLQAQTLDKFQIGTAATTGNTNDWPSAEAPGNAIDLNSATKYLNFGKLNTGYILTYPSAVTANGLALTTANDALERDPASFSLYGSTTVVANGTPGSTFKLSDFTLLVNSQALSLPDTRLTAAGAVTFTNANAYTTYLLVFPTVKNAGAANSMQIAEAVLTNGGTAISTAGTTIGGGQLIPEPASALLLGTASVSVLGLRRRRK
jgi:hypothetical protein